MKRLPDWRDRLDAYLFSLEGRAFDWKTISCGLFAASCVQAETGEDFAVEFAGEVSDAASAHRALEKRGFKTIADLAASRLLECGVSELRMGDIASVDLPEGPTLYLVNAPPLSLLGIGRRGKTILSFEKARRGFRVG